MKLEDGQISELLKTLPRWSLKNGKLHREYQFDDFKNAFAFMSQAADSAEEMQHHPEWFNVYSKVTVDLFTHDVGGLSQKDFSLAKKMDEYAALQSR